MLEKLFKLKENGTTVKTEIIAGLTTFMTMAYIIALNPNLLVGFWVERRKFVERCFPGNLYCFRNRHVCDGICRKQALCHGARNGLEQFFCSGGCKYFGIDGNGLSGILSGGTLYYSD